MKTRKNQLLLIEDDKIDQMAFIRFAIKNNFPFILDNVDSIKEAKEKLKSKKYSIIVSDFYLGDGTAFDLLKEIKDTPVIIITGLGDEDVAVKAMKLGAYDYLIKDVEGKYLNLLSVTINNAIKHFRTEQKLKKYHKNLEALVSERTAELKEEIAERKKAEEILSSSEERLKILFEYAPDAYYISNLQGILIDANKAVEDLIGYRREELIGENILALKLISTSQYANITKSITKGTLGKRSEPVELILIHKDGHKVPVEVTTFSVKIHNKVVLLGIAHDLSERKNADKALIESEEKYRLLSSNALDTIWTTDKKFNITFVNNAIYNFLGYTPEEFIGLNPSVFTTADGLLLIKKEAEQLITYYKKGEINQSKFELQQIKKDGTVIDVEISTNILLNSDKKFIGFQGRSVDISRRKEAERAITEFNNIINRSLSVVFLWENKKDWPIKYVSENVKKLTGYSAQEFTDSKITYEQIIYPDDLKKIERNITKKESNQIRNHKYYRIIAKNGDIKWVEDITTVRKDSNGNIEAYEGIVTDITNRKKNEELITKLSSAVKQSPSVIVITALNGSVEYVNPKFTELTGYTYEETIGKNPRILKSGEMSDEIYKKLWETISSGKEWRGEFHNRKKNGELFWESAYISPIISDEGEIINYLKVAENITERKQIETNLKAALKKATEADRLKSAFLATMSHELRTPLNAIIGFSELINRDLAIDDIIKFSKIINSSGEHLLSIVNDLFDISLIESGEVKIIEKEVVLQSVLDNVYEIIKAKQQRDGKGNIEVNMKISSKNSNLTIVTDESKLSQILINLLKNALKFTQDGHISFGYNIETKQGKPMLLFFVEDTGIGIPKNSHKGIFEIFRQVDESLSRKFGGTGIGLSISKKLVELLKGEIWVKSDLGVGSTFYFTIPLNRFIKNISPANNLAENSKLVKEKTILIAEDSELSFEYLATVFNNSKYNIIRAENGAEAVALCKENTNIDLVLMDITMPEMDGYEATKIIKQFRPRLPIIAQTAHAVAGDREKALDAGCDDYISKPINRKILIKIIERLL